MSVQSSHSASSRSIVRAKEAARPQTVSTSITRSGFGTIAFAVALRTGSFARTRAIGGAALAGGTAWDDLVLMDRGFWNYGLFWQIARQEAYFAIVHRRIPLKTLKKLDKHDRLVTWKPSKKSNKKGLMSWKGVPRDITCA